MRRDRSSALPVATNSYIYPSVSGSVILSINDANWFSFAKLRANYAQVGNDVSPYRTLTNTLLMLVLEEMLPQQIHLHLTMLI